MTRDILKLEDLHRSTFDPYLEQKFVIHLGPTERLEVELVQISERKSPNTESFALLFLGPFDKVLSQKIYRMEHAEMGAFELFLVPVMVPSDRGIHYEALFNRLV